MSNRKKPLHVESCKQSQLQQSTQVRSESLLTDARKHRQWLPNVPVHKQRLIILIKEK